jgi:hypothetical protein
MTAGSAVAILVRLLVAGKIAVEDIEAAKTTPKSKRLEMTKHK